MSGDVWWPRRHAWFVVLLGLLSVAHLWSHAVQAPDHPHTFVTASGDSGHHEHENEEDHGEQEHSHLFVAPVVNTCADGLAAWPGSAVLPAVSGHGRTVTALGRAPPGDYRGRAALTQTLEVCRC
ncbi:hypothetical protein [Nonomuraea sp. KM88]|uniref:hypothetical protein n=1 Tax=Nonomuraea sp. KM88 TaxID=3457427 RepID=UPI003FCC9AF5